jgi:hypothetical protein
MPAVKCCSNCGREIFSTYRGDITVKPPARVERIEAAGNVVAICACGRRVIWFKLKKQAQATITAG